MKVLFCYDGPIVKNNENNYYGIAINDEMLIRYEKIAENINIAIRVKTLCNDDISKFSLINKQKYNIIECPNLLSIKGFLFNRKKCKKIIEEQVKKADYIIARLPSMIGNLSIKIAKKYKRPYLVELVGCPWDALWNHSTKGKIIAPYMWYITKRRISNAPNVIYVSNKFLQNRYPTKGKELSCSDVVLEKIDDSVLEKRLNKITENNNIVIGTLGAINVKYKGQQYVIKAVNKLKKQGINLEYEIVGGGDNQYLSKLIKKYKLEENVKILGKIEHKEVFKWLDNIDIYIQPSNQEGLCRALVEAMSRACPCIASNVGGNPELIDKKYIFRKKNVKNLMNKIKNMSSEEMKEQAKINFNKAKKYDKEKLEKKRNKFYEEIKRKT